MQSKNVSFKALAMQRLQSGSFVEARKLAGEAYNADRRDVQALTIMAAASAGLGAMDEVAEACRSIIALQPDNPIGHYNLGVAYQAMGKHDKAESAYRKTLKLQPGNAAAATNLGLALIALDRTQEAIKLYDNLLAQNPNMAAAHNGIALALKARGEFEAALERLNRSLTLSPHYPETHYNLGLLYAACGDPSRAKNCLEKAIELKPDYAEAHYELGMILCQEEDYRGSEREFREALKIRPHYNAALFQLAHSQYLQDDFRSAIHGYREFLAREPGNISALNNLGRVYERIGKYDDAIQQYRDALNKNNRDSTIHCNIGRIHMLQQNWNAAAESYREAIDADPSSHEGYMGLGRAHSEIGDIESAKDCYRSAIDLNPDLSIARYLLASADNIISSDTSITEYVKSLFDHYAENFDADLLGKLEYGVPEVVNDVVRGHIKAGDKLAILDLGCGTGLCGALLKNIASRLDGIDVSGQMIEKARERGIYDNLHNLEITEFLASSSVAYDLIVATDVFIYIAYLEPIFDAIAQSLNQGGLFAFSIELHDGEGSKIRSSARLAQSESYIEELCGTHNLDIVLRTNCDIRLEYGIPIRGMVYLARKQ